MVISRFNIFLFLLFVSVNSFAQDIIDSLQRQVKITSGKEKVFYLNELSWNLLATDLKKAEEVSKEALELAKKIKDKKSIAESHNGLGIVYLKTGDFEQSLKENQNALKIRREIKDKRGIASSQSKIGSIFMEQSDFEKALKVQQEALSIFEELNDVGAIAQTLNNICNIHKGMRDHESMLKYAKKSIALCEKVNFQYGLGSAYGNMGVYYQRMNVPDSSIYWNLKAREILVEHGYPEEVTICDNNLGVAYRLKGDHQKGLYYYQQAYERSKEMNDPSGTAQYGTNVGSVLNHLHQYPKAIPYLKEALPYALKHKLDRLRSQIYDVMASSYMGMKDYEKAFYYKERFGELKDSLFNADRAEKFSEMEVKFETAKKEKENRELTIKNQRQQIEIKEKEKTALIRRNWIIGGGLLSVILIISVYFYNYRKRKNEEAQHQRQLITEREEGLKAVVSATENERKKIARDLHDGVGQQMTGIKMRWQNLSTDINKKSPELYADLIDITKVLDEASGDVRTISHQMMSRVLLEMGLIPAIEDVLEKSLKGSSIQYDFLPIKITQRFPEEIELGLYRIFQEILNNCLKHAQARNITIQLIHQGDHLVLRMEDDGIGFDTEKATQGLGLKSLKSRIDSLKGNLDIESSPGNGSTITIRVRI